MMRRTPMKRTGFKMQPKQPLRHANCDVIAIKQIAKLAVKPNYAPSKTVVAIPKENALQHAGYEAAVRKLPCAMCGVVGFTQFCHSDEGKGTGIKTDCRRGWPGCGPHNGQPGCHWIVGTSGRLPREERRAFEARAAQQTRQAVIAMGAWPKRLPLWIEPTPEEVTA